MIRNNSTIMYHRFQYDFSFCIFLYQAFVILLSFTGVAPLYDIPLLNINYVLHGTFIPTGF